MFSALPLRADIAQQNVMSEKCQKRKCPLLLWRSSQLQVSWARARQRRRSF